MRSVLREAENLLTNTTLVLGATRSVLGEFLLAVVLKVVGALE